MDKYDQNKNKPSITDFEFLDILGSGNFGEVRLVKHSTSNNCFALKIMKKDEIMRAKQIEHIKRERDLLMKLSEDGYCKFIVKFHGSL